MNEQKYVELERRASQSLAQREIELQKAALYDEVRKLQAASVVRDEIEAMKAEGKALTLTDEEIEMIRSFRRFKVRMRKHGEVFKWQTRMEEGIQVVSDTAEIVHPSEA